MRASVVICWKIRIFAYWTTPICSTFKGVPCCDLLKNSYLCLLNNTAERHCAYGLSVVICWKIRIFAYWTTPLSSGIIPTWKLWFAEKFVSLLIEQHPTPLSCVIRASCDLLKNSYLCLLNNTPIIWEVAPILVVICWKIRIFAYWTTPLCTSLLA